jgi:hypothetical protein
MEKGQTQVLKKTSLAKSQQQFRLRKKKKSSIEAVVAGDVSTVTAHISMCCKYKAA